MSKVSIQKDTGDRRRGKRFPIQTPVRYKVLEYGSIQSQGTGTTLNFSKSGIQFTTTAELPIGATIEFSVDWPAQLGENCALQFVGAGRVVRSADGRVAVKIYQHEFKTRGKLTPVQHSTTEGIQQPRV